MLFSSDFLSFAIANTPCVKNIYTNFFTNAVNSHQCIFIVAPIKAHYDTSAEAISVRIRDGRPKYIVEGSGNFVISADDSGIWALDLEIKRWKEDYREIVEILRKAHVDIWY